MKVVEEVECNNFVLDQVTFKSHYVRRYKIKSLGSLQVQNETKTQHMTKESSPNSFSQQNVTRSGASNKPFAHEACAPVTDFTLSPDHIQNIMKALQDAVDAVTFMHDGAENGHKKWVDNALITLRKVAVDKPLMFLNARGDNALQLAIMHNKNNDIVEILFAEMLQTTAYVNLSETSKTVVMHRLLSTAIEFENKRALKFLQSHQDVIKYGYQTVEEKVNPLIGIAAVHCPSVLKQLITEKVDVDACDSETKLTGLMFAVCKDAKSYVIKQLIKLRANCNAKNRLGNTALHFAVAKKNVTHIKLLKDITDHEITNDVGETPFQSSADVQLAVKVASTEEVVSFSEFIFKLMRSDRVLAVEFIHKRLPTGKRQTLKNVRAYVDDIFNHTLVMQNLTVFTKLFGIVNEAVDDSGTSSSDIVESTKTPGVIVNQDLKKVILGYCCNRACLTGSIQVIDWLGGCKDTIAFFADDVTFLTHESNNTHNKNQFKPLVMVAFGGYKPLATVKCLKKLNAKFDVTYGSDKKSVLMDALYRTAKLDDICWFMREFPASLDVKDVNGSNVLHHLFTTRSHEVTTKVLSYAVRADNTLLVQKNYSELLPIQMGYQLEDKRKKSAQFQRLVSNYYAKNEVYLARALVEAGNDVDIPENAVNKDVKLMRNYSKWVSDLFKVTSDSAIKLDDFKRKKVVNVTVYGMLEKHSQSDIECFVNLMEKEQFPSEVYLALGDVASILNDIVNDLKLCSTYCMVDKNDANAAEISAVEVEQTNTSIDGSLDKNLNRNGGNVTPNGAIKEDDGDGLVNIMLPQPNKGRSSSDSVQLKTKPTHKPSSDDKDLEHNDQLPSNPEEVLSLSTFSQHRISMSNTESNQEDDEKILSHVVAAEQLGSKPTSKSIPTSQEEMQQINRKVQNTDNS